jgi:hypothetical protein
MLAGRVLEAWERAPSTSPIPIGEPAVRAAFLTGALAPDAGFVPGTKRRMSEFAHYVAPGDLTRALLAEAATPEERAFALGWATHVLGDVELHPLVGRAVGEHLFGDRSVRVNAADDVATHVSLEVGLDLAVGEAEGAALPEAPARTWVTAPSARYLARALELTYEVGWQPRLLLRDQVRSGRMMRWWPTALGLVKRANDGGVVARLLGCARALAPEGSAHRGFFRPGRPVGWLLDEVQERAAGFADRFQRGMDDGMAMLGNRNLETGEENPPGSGHPATDRAWADLEAARGSGGRGSGAGAGGGRGLVARGSEDPDSPAAPRP